MSPVPPPRPSPTPQTSAADSPSGVHRLAELAQGTAWQTKVQWGVVGAVVVAIGSLGNWGLTKLDLVNSAQAQVQERTTAHAARLDRQEQRLEAIDAGSRAAIERLERKIDANNEQTQALLKQVLVEARKR